MAKRKLLKVKPFKGPIIFEHDMPQYEDTACAGLEGCEILTMHVQLDKKGEPGCMYYDNNQRLWWLDYDPATDIVYTYAPPLVTDLDE